MVIVIVQYGYSEYMKLWRVKLKPKMLDYFIPIIPHAYFLYITSVHNSEMINIETLVLDL